MQAATAGAKSTLFLMDEVSVTSYDMQNRHQLLSSAGLYIELYMWRLCYQLLHSVATCSALKQFHISPVVAQDS